MPPSHLSATSSHLLPPKKLPSSQRTAGVTKSKLSTAHTFSLSLLTAAFLLAGCTSDKAGTTRIIEQDKKEEEIATSAYTLTLAMPLTGATVQLYDLTNKKSLGSVNVSTRSKDANGNTIPENKLTLADKGMAAKLSLPTKEVDKNALVLNTLTLPAGKTYFDPVLGRKVRLSEDKTLYALANGKNLSNTPTAFTTLALYRTLARLGWFYEHDALPTQDELSKLINSDNAELVQTQYGAALGELGEALLYNAYPAAISSYDELKALAGNATNTSYPTLKSWVTLIAQLRVYAQSFGSSAPFFDLAKDLSVDFFDGDIDGHTLAGVKPKLGKTLVNAPKNTNPELNPVSQTSDYKFDALYDVQKLVLTSFESRVLAQLGNTLTDIGIASSNEKYGDLVKFFSTDDAAQNQAQQADNKTDNASYNDLRTGSLTPFVGVGDKTYAFGLGDGVNTSNFIDGQSSNDYSGVAAIAGRYMSGDCMLTIGVNGDITLAQGANSHRTLLDRTSNDNITRISGQSYALNSFQLNDDGETYRLIQVRINQGAVNSASTKVTSLAGADTPTNPDFGCTF